MGVKDEQFVQLKAEHMIMRTPYITTGGIAQLVKVTLKFIADFRDLKVVNLVNVSVQTPRHLVSFNLHSSGTSQCNSQ